MDFVKYFIYIWETHLKVKVNGIDFVKYFFSFFLNLLCINNKKRTGHWFAKYACLFMIASLMFLFLFFTFSFFLVSFFFLFVDTLCFNIKKNWTLICQVWLPIHDCKFEFFLTFSHLQSSGISLFSFFFLRCECQSGLIGFSAAFQLPGVGLQIPLDQKQFAADLEKTCLNDCLPMDPIVGLQIPADQVLFAADLENAWLNDCMLPFSIQSHRSKEKTRRK